MGGIIIGEPSFAANSREFAQICANSACPNSSHNLNYDPKVGVKRQWRENKISARSSTYHMSLLVTIPAEI